jgi:hypothetical protein
MKVNHILLLLVIPCMVAAMKCEKETANCHHNLWLNNQSDKEVYVTYSFNHPDTSLPLGDPPARLTTIGAYERKNFYHQSECIERFISDYTRNYEPKDTLCIFVVDAALVASVGWDQVRRNNLVLKRFDYSTHELKNTNFSIDYP